MCFQRCVLFNRCSISFSRSCRCMWHAWWPTKKMNVSSTTPVCEEYCTTQLHQIDVQNCSSQYHGDSFLTTCEVCVLLNVSWVKVILVTRLLTHLVTHTRVRAHTKYQLVYPGIVYSYWGWRALPSLCNIPSTLVWGATRCGNLSHINTRFGVLSGLHVCHPNPIRLDAQL